MMRCLRSTWKNRTPKSVLREIYRQFEIKGEILFAARNSIVKKRKSTIDIFAENSLEMTNIIPTTKKAGRMVLLAIL
jgi:hypothetical protein